MSTIQLGAVQHDSRFKIYKALNELKCLDKVYPYVLLTDNKKYGLSVGFTAQNIDLVPSKKPNRIRLYFWSVKEKWKKGDSPLMSIYGSVDEIFNDLPEELQEYIFYNLELVT